MSLSAKSDSIRLQLNLKQLQRHDPDISTVVSSTSYASVYENKGEGWVKTGVEGPMFLFSRTVSPRYGFFVLNRQGLEYVQEFLTPESEVKVEGEFILFEGGNDVDRATGIWVFEEKERVELCRAMEQLRRKSAATASVSSPQPAPAPPVGQSISLDMLFNAASPASSPAITPAVASRPSGSAAPNPLDALFAAATTSPAPAARTVPAAHSAPSPVMARPQAPPASALPTTLEQLFAAASPTPQAARLPPQPASPAVQAAKPSGMALLDSIFASAKQSPQPQSAGLPSTASPYQTPQPQSAHLPHSPLPGTGSHTLPPVSPSQPGAQDARTALLSMIGLSSPAASTPSATSPSLTSAAQPVQANPLVNGDIASPSSAPVPAPSTTTHPAPFSMQPAPAEQPAAQTQKTAPAPAKKLPMFAPPLLSHDIFGALPPSKKKPTAEAQPTPAAPPSAAPVAVEPAQPSPAAPATTLPSAPSPPPAHSAEPSAARSLLSPSGPLDSPALPSPAAVASPSPPLNGAPQSLLLGKAELLAAIDGAASSGKVGIVDGQAPLEKDEFVRRVVEMVQKPSFAMQLYGRYLERFEDEH